MPQHKQGKTQRRHRAVPLLYQSILATTHHCITVSVPVRIPLAELELDFLSRRPLDPPSNELVLSCLDLPFSLVLLLALQRKKVIKNVQNKALQSICESTTIKFTQLRSVFSYNI